MLSASHANLVSRMLRDIDTGYHQTCGLTGRGNLPENIRQAFTDVKRHEFVPSELRSYAYENHPLPIGHGQTISQPFIVALMTDLLDLKNTDRVLEVGCGCGYQAAILSLLVAEVYSTEIIPTLAHTAEKRLQRLGFNNVKVEERDGYYGWPEHSPFDAIIVTAAAATIPKPLMEQLAPGRRLLIPVGLPSQSQRLMAITKGKGDKYHAEEILGVAFVPLTGDHGEEE